MCLFVHTWSRWHNWTNKLTLANPLNPSAVFETPTSAESQQQKWQDLKNYLLQYFHAPDLEALLCVLSAIRAQYAEGDPVWLFVIGPSGSGKTAIAVNCASALPRTYVESSLTTRSLLSGTTDGAKSSLLEIVKDGILIFKDFTTILSKREDDQKEIISQFREVFDGRFSIRTGQRSTIWEGKITVIAATTPAIERAWAVHRDLGERFLQVRWFKSDSRKIAKAARSQRGREREIARKMRELTKAFFSSSFPTPSLSETQGSYIDDLATAVAHLRGHISRDPQERSIIDAADPEEPTRIAKALDSLVCNHAGLFWRPVVPEDFALARRVGFDSVPSKRIKIMQALPTSEIGMSRLDLPFKTGIPESSCIRQLEEMKALGLIISTDAANGYVEVKIHPNFLGIWLAALQSPLS